MGVALMPHVEQDLVPGKIQGAMQRHRQFHHPQIGGQVAAGGGNALDQKIADFGAQGGQVPQRQTLDIPRLLDLIQQRIGHSFCTSLQKMTAVQTIGIAKPITAPKAAPVTTWIGVWPTISLSFLSPRMGRISDS